MFEYTRKQENAPWYIEDESLMKSDDESNDESNDGSDNESDDS